MTKEQLATSLDGREYPLRLSEGEVAQAKRDELVVVYGSSDDLMEFEGVVNEEVRAPGITLIAMKGRDLHIFEDHDGCNCEFCGYKEAVKTPRKIEAVWCPTPDVSWAIVTDIPHATFSIREDGGVFCLGIVFAIKDVTPCA